MRETLRVIDFGHAPPLRSQTLWHAIVHGVDRGQPATLSFVRTTLPYVSIGFHRSLAELDQERCRRNGWPVLRRRVGGGPVYMDRDQLCFQITVPASTLPASRLAATRFLLEPAVEAFRAAGLEAELDATSEVVVGDRKVCGHGAAQIGSAVVVVGNLIESFDHAAAASILKTPDEVETAETLQLMRRYVAFDVDAPAVDASAFAAAARESYGRALGASPRDGSLGGDELDELGRLDRLFEDPAWVDRSRRPDPGVWTAKIKGRVWRYFVGGDGRRLGLSVVDGRIVAARVEGFGADSHLEKMLVGSPLADSPARVASLASPGRLVKAPLEQLVSAGHRGLA